MGASNIADSEAVIDYDIVISDTQLDNGYYGYDLLPKFINKGIFSVLISSNNYKNEANHIGCPFYLKVLASGVVDMATNIQSRYAEFINNE